MVRVTVWLQLLLVVLILRQSTAVSDQCSKQQDEISRLYGEILKIRDLRNANQDRADNCHEKLTKQILILEATARKLKESESDNSGLKEQLDEYKTKFQQSEAVISGLKKKLVEYRTKFQQSEAVISGLKKQLEIKEEVLKSNNQKQTQLQTDIDGLTKTVQSMNQLLQRLCETPEHVCRYLFEAAKSGDVDTVKILFKCSNDNCTDYDERRSTPLIYAAIFGHVEVVRVLLEGGANVDRADAYRRTALHLAAYEGHVDVCRLLLDWGAKVDRLNMWQNTPLHYAAWKRRFYVVKLLVERGADVNLKNNIDDIASVVPRKVGKKDVQYLRELIIRGQGLSTV